MERNSTNARVTAILSGFLAASQVAAASEDAGAGYPADLHGTWLPPDISCTTLDGAGSDAVIVIRQDRLRRYEDSHTIRSARRIAESPATWLVESALSLGGDPPDASSNIFVLAGSELVIAGDDIVSVYRKCR